MERKNKLVLIGSTILLISMVLLTILITYQSTKAKKTKSRASELANITPFVTLAPPQDIPSYPGADLVGASTVDHDRQQTFIWQTGDEPTTVFNRVKEDLFKAGWESVTGERDTPNNELKIALLKNNRSLRLSVGVNTDIGKTTITALIVTSSQ